ncbi:hypothetical protein [Metabacillus sp. 22489]|uniref:hypothetical protein n=1 Tax=Metabacillus sp. 22489 TaxID=3453928 RepID=UPI003F86416A
MYRPTVRYSDTYKAYINDLFHSTTLDRNQLLRLALHVAAHSDHFKRILSNYKSSDAPLPQSNWKVDNVGLWMDNTSTIVEGGLHFNAIHTRGKSAKGTVREVRKEAEQTGCKQQTERREGEIPSRTIRNQGGIKFIL